jgi:hypothetical protein
MAVEEVGETVVRLVVKAVDLAEAQQGVRAETWAVARADHSDSEATQAAIGGAERVAEAREKAEEETTEACPAVQVARLEEDVEETMEMEEEVMDSAAEAKMEAVGLQAASARRGAGVKALEMSVAAVKEEEETVEGVKAPAGKGVVSRVGAAAPWEGCTAEAETAGAALEEAVTVTSKPCIRCAC